MASGYGQAPGIYYIREGEVVYRAATALSAWTGHNRALRGEVRFDGRTLTGRICLDLSAWDSGNPLRDAHTRRMFQVERFPESCFSPQKLIKLADGLVVQGELNLHGRKGIWSLKGALGGEGSSFNLRLAGLLSLRSWGLQPPRFLGLEVKDEVEVSVQALLERTR